MPRDRLSPLDRSFLQIESPTAHMHVGCRARFGPAPQPLTLPRLRALVDSRLHVNPRFRQRLAFPPGGFGAPVWVDDEHFELAAHVTAHEGDPLSHAAFAELADRVLSEPLDRTRPLWHIELVPRLQDGGSGLILKAHHAMVDGLSALALGLLLLDVSPTTEVLGHEEWAPRPAPGGARLAAEALAGYGEESLRAAMAAARAVGSGTRIVDSVRRAALTVGEDVLRPAPASYLNVPLSPRRTVAGYRAELAGLLHAKRQRAVTLNDVALAVVAGALRQVAAARGALPAPLKAMVPVSRRDGGDDAPGNQIAFVSVHLPLHVRDPLRRLDAIAAQTRAFKASGRASGSEALLRTLGVLPPVVQDAAARFAASARAYNLVVSNVPGPRVPVYLLGAELVEALPVVPLSDGHALAIGMLSLRDALCFGVHADPEALPDAGELPGALAAATLELVRAAERRTRRAA